MSAGETVKFDSRHRRQDGSIFPVEVRIRPFWVDDEKYMRFLWSNTSPMNLRERSLRLTQFSVDHAAIAVFWVRDSVIRYVNDLVCESLKYSQDELVGMSIVEITDHTLATWQERFEQVKNQRSVSLNRNTSVATVLFSPSK